MKKIKPLIFLIVISAVLYLAYAYKNKQDENSLVECFNDVLVSLEMDTIYIDVSGRIQSPIISGKTNTKLKRELIQTIGARCNIQSFEDLIIEMNEFDFNTATINFKLDGFNKVATLTGIVNSGFEQQEILSNFTTAVNMYYGPWSINHDIIISKKVSKSEFAINITLVFSAISLVRATDITLINEQIIIKGLVRDQSKEAETLSQLHKIFQDDLEIVDQLEPVIKDSDALDELQIELDPIELLEIKPPVEFEN